ncbi:unnamed protein product [Vitrella brassicaformis CCMP3155]|uniref:Uncharacterized protein n=1 Tax=Vitrella brassicaformis (strain CCMP3155) TaxID=1169540 RepID=A0A0G4FBB9_VITBC|nr:unnamed protein product [Vitrella brassicaformis CCMP3155]|eukprot:CEM10174.1 unnamed protein product [Vitrella brassicaformis CCMP3155]
MTTSSVASLVPLTDSILSRLSYLFVTSLGSSAWMSGKAIPLLRTAPGSCRPPVADGDGFGDARRPQRPPQAFADKYISLKRDHPNEFCQWMPSLRGTQEGRDFGAMAIQYRAIGTETTCCRRGLPRPPRRRGVEGSDKCAGG